MTSKSSPSERTLKLCTFDSTSSESSSSSSSALSSESNSNSSDSSGLASGSSSNDSSPFSDASSLPHAVVASSSPDPIVRLLPSIISCSAIVSF